MKAVEVLRSEVRSLDKPKLTLIVDDDLIVCEIASDILSDAGFRIICVRDGGQAIEAIWDHDPDVAVLDMVLPHTTGLQILKHVRLSGVLCGLPCVVMSGCSGARPADLALRAGANAFLRKPFNRAIFVTEVVGVTEPEEAISGQ